MEDCSIPDHGVIIDRLKVVAKIQSDAGLSRWLGKPEAFIGVCRNRSGISLDVFIPKLTDAQLIFVLRGRMLPDENEEIPAIRLPTAVIDALDDLEVVASDIGVSQKTLHEWSQGKRQPTHRQLVTLFNEVARSTGVLFKACSGASASISRPGGKLKMGNGSR